MKYIDFIRRIIIRILFPPHCLVCHVPLAEDVVCTACRDAIPRNAHFFCAACGARIPFHENELPRKICHRNAPYILGAAGSYGDTSLKLLIHSLKFRGIRRAAEPLAEIVARYIADTGADLHGFILIPLPLHRRRRNRRGFNQAEEMARHLARRLRLEMRNDVLARARHVKPQTETAGAAERRLNIAGCFSVTKPEAVLHRDIIILDDVATSGATLQEAAGTLKAAGARRIIGLVAAKT